MHLLCIYTETYNWKIDKITEANNFREFNLETDYVPYEGFTLR